MAQSLPAELPEIISLDALGTLIEVVDPVGGLVAALAQRGVTVSSEQAAEGLGAEMAYYRANSAFAGTPEALEQLRDRSTEVLTEALPQSASVIGFAAMRESLGEAVRFASFPEVDAVLDALRAAGARLVIVSNWDISLYEVLDQIGLRERVDAVVISAEEGLAKPDPELIRRAVSRVGGGPESTVWHVGDDPASDLELARAAGVLPVLVDRYAQYGSFDEVIVLDSLEGLLPSDR
jgi:putative hydrolase of the HAD superfamily